VLQGPHAVTGREQAWSTIVIMQPLAPDQDPPALRWGFVGTGKIARWMADVLRHAPMAELAAVASRSSATATAFAGRHGAGRAFGSWPDMLSWEGIDAVYVATPTALREEMCVAAARAGKHVLGEKPFASLASLRRIVAACRANGVAFMDATHFVHHPRTAAIVAHMHEVTGRPRALDSSFLVALGDRSDIRYESSLEPLGALGDLGWYNMRATLAYLAPTARLCSVSARLCREAQTGVVIAADGVLTFDDGTVSRWRCGFEAEAPVIELRLSGNLGQIEMDNFVGEEPDGAASYRYRPAGAAGRAGGAGGDDASATLVRVQSRCSGPSLMFQDFAASALDASRRESWMQASERTQALLDAVLESAECVRRA
jgi:predicted dehydrogenase